MVHMEVDPPVLHWLWQIFVEVRYEYRDIKLALWLLIYVFIQVFLHNLKFTIVACYTKIWN